MVTRHPRDSFFSAGGDDQCRAHSVIGFPVSRGCFPCSMSLLETVPADKTAILCPQVKRNVAHHKQLGEAPKNMYEPF